MELLLLILGVLFWWWVIRAIGWLFNGPRHRARVMRRKYKRAQRNIQYDAWSYYEMQTAMREDRRGRW